MFKEELPSCPVLVKDIEFSYRTELIEFSKIQSLKNLEPLLGNLGGKKVFIGTINHQPSLGFIKEEKSSHLGLVKSPREFYILFFENSHVALHIYYEDYTQHSVFSTSAEALEYCNRRKALPPGG